MWTYTNLDGIDCKHELTEDQIQENNHFTNVIQNIPFFQTNATVYFPVEVLGTWSTNGYLAIVEKNNIKYYIKKYPVMEIGCYIAIKMLNAFSIKVPKVSFYFTQDDKIPILYISREADIIIKEIKRENEQDEKIAYKYESFNFLRPERFLPSWNNKFVNFVSNFEIKHAVRRFALYLLLGIEDAGISNNSYYLNKNNVYKSITFDLQLLHKYFNCKHSFNPLEDNFWNYFTKFNMSNKYNFISNRHNFISMKVRNENIHSAVLLDYFYKETLTGPTEQIDDTDDKKHCLNDEQKYIILYALQKILHLKEDFKNKLNILFNEDMLIKNLMVGYDNYLSELLILFLSLKEKEIDFKILKKQNEIENLRISNLINYLTHNIDVFCQQLNEETNNWNKTYPSKQIQSYKEQKESKKQKPSEIKKEYKNQISDPNDELDMTTFPINYVFDFTYFIKIKKNQKFKYNI
jgi:hypothetical protein